MKTNSYTPDQLKAVKKKDGNCLVGAGAGSGKTFVLTNRISEMILSGIPLSNMLVLTFTNKAAFSMKEKTRDVLLTSGNPALVAEAENVDSAKIMTFDAFALDLVNTYRYELGLDKKASIADKSILDVILERAITELFDEEYEKALCEDTPFKKLVSSYCVKDDDALRFLVKRIVGLAELSGDKEAFYRDYVASHFNQSYENKAIEDLLAYFKDRISSFLSAEGEFVECPKTYQQDSDFLAPLLKAETFDEFYALASSSGLKLPNIVRGEGKNGEKEERTRLKKSTIIKVFDCLFLGDSSSIKAHYEGTKENVAALLCLAKELDDRMDTIKKEHSCFSFGDIARLARVAASIPSINKQLKDKYRYVMVDEYQDTSDLQESLISLINEENVFCVGDIKQSIYGFRNANPDIFLRRYDRYKKGDGGELITLKDNFRSRKQVIGIINEIFGEVMKREVGGVDYSSDQRLDFGQNNFNATEGCEDYGLENLYYDKDTKLSTPEQQASIIAEDIISKLGKFNLRGNGGQPRKATFGDFAILIARKSHFDVYQKVFASYHIPLDSTCEERAGDSQVLIVAKNLLKAADIIVNGGSEVSLKHLYASLARSFLFSRSDDEIYKAITGNTYRDDPFMARIKELSSTIRRLNVKEIAEKLFLEFGFVSKLRLIKNVKSGYEKLNHFLTLAEGASAFSWGLHDFITYFKDVEDNDIDIELSASKDEGDSVKLMTIHASKGLEFPIIYLPDLETPFSLDRGKSGSTILKTSGNYGIVLPNMDDGESAETIFHILDKEATRKANVSERMRLWYVALTRAQEMIVTIIENEREKDPQGGDKGHSYPSASKLSDSKCFYSFMHFAGVLPKHARTAPPGGTYRPLSNPLVEGGIINPQILVLDKGKAQFVPERASKGIGALTDEGALAYGEMLHGYMEGVDFKTKDASYIENAKDRAIIEKALSNPIFDGCEKAKAYKEYVFDNGGREAIIDLFLLYGDHIDLVDYKASNIDDPHYDEQLAVYETYLKAKFGLPVNKYLLSLIKGTVRKV